jgi:methylenetetrahydrofolate reductase (NADPH)
VSFEFFPPHDEPTARHLWDTIRRLQPLQPKFVSVTDGADGSTRARTRECVLRMSRETDLCVAPHMTCVGTSREETLALAQDYARHGIRHLVALRGDRPSIVTGAARDDSLHGDSLHGDSLRGDSFAHASDLVAALAATDVEISVAAYPEGHPESAGVAADVDNLKRKVDAGAHRAITQFFFDTEVYLQYRDRCNAAGIHIPIIPGILPIARFAQLQRFAARCGASLPNWLHERFAGLDDDPDTRSLVASNVAIEQIERLQAHGVDEFHFYTLNRAELTYAICHAIGVRPRAKSAAEVPCASPVVAQPICRRYSPDPDPVALLLSIAAPHRGARTARHGVTARFTASPRRRPLE